MVGRGCCLRSCFLPAPIFGSVRVSPLSLRPDYAFGVEGVYPTDDCVDRSDGINGVLRRDSKGRVSDEQSDALLQEPAVT